MGLAVQEDLHDTVSFHARILAYRGIRAQEARLMTKPIHVLAGPNLNLLGTREPEVYGHETLDDIRARLEPLAAPRRLVFRQTNSEGTLVDWVQAASLEGAGLILNAGAYTHTSIALHDALRACAVPIIEVHLSNPASREPFRHVNYVAPLAHGTIAGLGGYGYELAMGALRHILQTKGQEAT